VSNIKSAPFIHGRIALIQGTLALTCLWGGAADFTPLASERAGEEAARILSVLSGPLESEREVPEDWRDHLAPGFFCGSLLPGKPHGIYDGPEVSVTRFAGNSAVAGKGPAALEKEWAKLLEAWPGSTQRHVKFKIVRVDLAAPPAVKTRVLFIFTAQMPDGPAEHNATWDAEWITTGDHAPEMPDLKLKSLVCEEAEEARARGGAWFADCTESLLAAQPWFLPQMGRGNVWWRGWFQKEFEQFIYGHRGLAIGDANGDGLDDVYLCMEGGLPNRLLLGQPDGTVKEASREWGVDFLDNTRAALLVDLDGDADLDMVLAITRGILILENDGTRMAQKALLPRITDAYSLAAADYDGNGTVDFYGCGYQARDADPARLPWPAPFYDAQNGGENFLVRNEGGWKFSNATAETGLDQNNSRFSFAAVWTDYDNDGDPDLAVANDFGRNNLFEQRRVGGKITFVDVAAERGMANSAFGMSISAADFNRDGAFDFYVGNMFSSAGNRITMQPEFKKGLPRDVLDRFRALANGNALFLSDGKGAFKDHGVSAGVNMGRWTWGTLAADLNCDGNEDLLVANGNITGHSAAPDL
jgi:hypothetical protein